MAVRRAECAVYLGVDGRKADALHHASEALDDAIRVRPSSAYERRQLEFARSLAALAIGIVGRSAAAIRSLRRAKIASDSLSVRALCSASLALLKTTKSVAYDRSFIDALDELRALQYGGYALLLEAVFHHLKQFRQQAILRLTKSETEVLEALSSGSSAKGIANERGRSVHTIQAQIRSVIDKLGCSGRGEALAVARREGLLSKQ